MDNKNEILLLMFNQTEGKNIRDDEPSSEDDGNIF